MSGFDHQFWLKQARSYAAASKDPSTKVGAYIVRPDKTVCSTGTNGFPNGIADTPERLNDRPTKYDLTVHAELNSLIFAKEPVVGYTMYCTFAPCIRCAVAIIQSKIGRLVYYTSDNERWKDEQERAFALYAEAGIEVIGIEEESGIYRVWNDPRDHGIAVAQPAV